MTAPISVTFVGPDGRATTVRGTVGESVMALARRHGIEGIVAECGGSMTCATCHVRVTGEWTAVTGGPASEIEEEMLDEVAASRGPTSRLSCQIALAEDLDGLVVDLPERQV